MALWNKVLSGFNSDDETVNFGARTIAETDGSIYETSTLATIQSDGQVVVNPNVCASIQYLMLCVAVDKSITIFSDESCSDIVLSIGFDSLINTYCMSKDCSFVFIALDNGILHCLHITSGGKQVFDENIKEKFDDSVVKIFLHNTAAQSDIILVGSSGVIYSIKNFDTQFAHSALIDEDDNRLEEIVNGIEFVKIFEGSKTTQAACIDPEVSSGESTIVTIGKNIHLWPSDRYCGHLASLPFQYTKVQFFKNYGAMICLRNDGALSIVCLETLLGRKIWSGPVADFITVQDKSNDPYEILILNAARNGESTTLLQLVSFPEFHSKFEIFVPATTYLIDLVGCSVDNIVFLEHIKNSSEIIETIRVKAMVENKPEYRLERLLRRGQFDEAEIFARKFQLSLDSINEAKAAAFLNQLGPWTNVTNDAENLETFILTLDKINDVKYIYDCCNNALTSNYKQTRRLLLYARERITRHAEKFNNQDFTSLLPTLNAKLRKLETFEMIQNTRINVEQENAQEIEEWIRFSRVNLLQECVEHLSHGELSAAAAIWIRHLSELAPLITPSRTYDILNSISVRMAPSELWPWLSHFIPSVISLSPGALSEIILWGYQKTRSLEKYHRKEWPKIGLDFSRRLIELLSSQESTICLSMNQQCTSKDSHYHRLITLVQAMTDLLEIKTVHRIVLPLETYLDDSTNVVHLLLDKAHVDAIPSLNDQFLQQYMLKNSLQNDKVFSSYVQKTLNHSKSWWFWEKAPWEQRLSIVVGYIRDVQNRLRQVVDILKKAPVPWSDTIVTLTEVSCTSVDHPLVTAIRTESSGVAVKLILKKYGYAEDGFCNKLFRYIIKQDREEMFDDICELTKADNSMRLTAFSYCVNHHLNIGNIDKAIEILQLVDDDIAESCCQQVVGMITSGLAFEERPSWLTHYFEALGSIEAKLRNVLSQKSGNIVETNDFLKNIPDLKRIYKLYKHFNIWVSHVDFVTRKKQVLQDYIERLVSELETGKKSMMECCENLEKVSYLLDLPRLESVLNFFDETNETAILKRAITQMVENEITSKDGSASLNRLCSAWIENAERDPETSMLLKKLCVLNIANCSESQLSDALICHNRVNGYIEALGCEATVKPEMENRIINSDDQKYNLYHIYRDAAVSSENILLPLFRDSLKIKNLYADGREDGNDSDIQEEILSLVNSLMNRTKSLKNEHHDYALMQITKNLHYDLGSLLAVYPSVMLDTRLSVYSTTTETLLSQCIYTLLTKVVSSRSLDVALGLSCLSMLTEQEAIKWLTAAARSFKSDLARHREVINLGYEYCRITKLERHLYTFDCQKLLHRWGRRLTDYGISYKEILQSDIKEKRDILERVMRSRKPDLIPLFEDFCSDFGFEVNDCLLLYLQVLLTSWEPKLIFTEYGGRKELKINENNVRELNSRCKEVAVKIDDRALIKKHLAQLSPQINFYHYEVFLTMLELIGERDVERIQYFCFLQNYTRYGCPTELEREEWANLCHDNNSLPQISRWRLPYLPKIDQFKIITPELNLKSYEKWLSIAPILKIQPHVICTLAIKGSVTEAWESYVNDRNRSDVWSLYPRNSGVLKEIKKCVKSMSGAEGLYYATAALYFVVNHTPQGADQVAAVQECYVSAHCWQQQLSNDLNEKDEAMIEKIKDKYLRLTSKHILHTHGVGDEKYLSLIGNPEKLIRELYNDERIPERFTSFHIAAVPEGKSHRPDINAAATALGSIYSMNMTKIRYSYLLEWLQSESWEGKHNDSVTIGFGNATENAEDNSINEDNLLRACYILKTGDSEVHANFLINIGFEGEKESTYGAGVRFRALRVLQSIVDESTLLDLTKIDLQSFRQYMKSLQYLNELERLGLGYSVNSFESCSKEKLAQILLKTQFYIPRALILIIQICIDFGIHDHALLNSTLEQMVKQTMVKELEKFLPVMGTISHMENCNGYIAGWQLVITSPFGKLDTRPTARQTVDCIGSLRLLHACPVVAKLEFKDVIDRCFYCRQAYFAAALLPFLRPNDKDYVLQKIAKNFNISEITNDLNGLIPKGILTVPQSLLMLQTI